jgi:hypothetical protein
MRSTMSPAMRRLLASGLLPKRAGQPVKALVHIYFAELCAMDAGSVLQDGWIGEYRARWAAHRAAASVAAGDGGAWLEGDAARAIACDAMLVPVVTGDIDPDAAEELIVLCVRYHQIRTQAPAATGAAEGVPVPAGLIGRAALQAQQAAAVAAAADTLAEMEQQILATVPPGRLRPRRGRLPPAPHPAGQGPERPSLPLDVGQTDDIPSTCAAWSPYGTMAASTPAAATSPHPAARPTTWCTGPTAGGPAWPT